MKKYILILLFLPLSVSAAWYNPVSWFSKGGKTTEQTVKCDSYLKEIENLKSRISELEGKLAEKPSEKIVEKPVIKTETKTIIKEVPVIKEVETPAVFVPNNYSDLILKVSGNKDLNASRIENPLKSQISIPFNTYRKIILRKISLELTKFYLGEEVNVRTINIQGQDFKMEQRGNYLIWEGYKELNGGGEDLFTINFNLPMSYCLRYKINSDSLSIFERTELDMQNISQNSYLEKAIKLTGDFPFYSFKLCNK